MDTPEHTCRKCGRAYPRSAEYWHSNKATPDGLHYTCKVCRNDQQRVYGAGLLLKRSTVYARRIRDAALMAYGGPQPACACCGESHREFLALDHINGGGLKHRKLVGGSTGKLYRWMRDQGYPPGFRVLCHNCNMAMGFFGVCPHERERQQTQ